MEMINYMNAYLPDLISLGKIGNSKINKTFKKYEDRIAKLKSKGELNIIPHCLFDWILLAESGSNESISFLKFVNEQVKTLFIKTDSKFHEKIRSKLSELAFSIDQDVDLPNNPVYLNFLGEIVGLNHIISFENKKFTLEDIERNLPNRKQSDFVFYDNETKELLYIDFVSIHNIDVSKLSCNQDLISFFEYRFNQKISSKTEGLTDNFSKIKIDEELEVNFAILPIVWAEIKDLLAYREAFELIDSKYANVFSCCSLLPEELEDKTFHYSFTTVTNILERWNEV